MPQVRSGGTCPRDAVVSEEWLAERRDRTIELPREIPRAVRKDLEAFGAPTERAAFGRRHFAAKILRLREQGRSQRALALGVVTACRAAFASATL